MTIEAPLDPMRVPLAGAHLIEASAGTGKTWTITALLLRLVLEHDIPVSRILVVTYTNAATRELRSRIRQVLVKAARSLRSQDQAAVSLLTDEPISPDIALHRIRRAILDFDEAAIFTIHGFCQRVLSNRAFESAMPFEAKLLPDESGLLREVVDDFWRLNVYSADPLWASYLLNQRADDPDHLLQGLRHVVGRSYLQVTPLPPLEDTAPSEQAQEVAFQALKTLWGNECETIRDLLMNHAGLNRNVFRLASIPQWFTQMDDFLDRPQPDFNLFGLFHRFNHFQTSVLQTPKSLKKGCDGPRHAFFNACDRYAETHAALLSLFDLRYQHLQRALFDYTNHELQERKKDRHVQSYEDLLTRLQRALKTSQGNALAETLRADYQAALVDEFQDTDPVQYDILQRIFIDGALPTFLIGDPKQAIYSFRGADIFSYLRARRTLRERHRLGTNWRSSDRLLQAVNALFGGGAHANPFCFKDIPFNPAAGAPNQRPELTDDSSLKAALVCWHLKREVPEKPLSKEHARQVASAGAANEIVRLLTDQPRLGERTLAAQDIAVLVRTHHEADWIEHSLRNAGVPTIRQTQGSVFETDEATDLERILIAIANPTLEASVRVALLTELLGHDADDLERLAADAGQWDKRLGDFHRYRALWHDHGFARMFRKLVTNEGLHQRLLTYTDGERRLTNVLHLGELLQAQAGPRGGATALLKWLNRQRDIPTGDQDEWLLRLESDADRVRIVTIHASKGLEYPVVFCPFTFGGELRVSQNGPLVFHDAQSDSLTVDFGSAADSVGLIRAREAAFAENLRLLYVALTRAQSRCYITWGAVNDAATAPLAWLLHHREQDPGQNLIEALTSQVRSLTDDDIAADLQRVAQQAKGAMIVTAPPNTHARYQLPNAVSLQSAARVFSRQLPLKRRMHSFTALSRDQETDLPDHDSLIQRRPDISTDPLRFPRGARAGTCLHRILETVDFTDPLQGPQRTTINQLLRAGGFSEEWGDNVVNLLQRVLATPLDGQRLADITREQRCDELEFYYPLASLTADALKALLSQHRFGHGSLANDWVERLQFETAAGYLHGFIDLVFESKGRYFVVDYKSNDLGPRDEDYAPERLLATMVQEHYLLQYLIYTLAVHRYLRLRLPDYDYEQHFGGVYYLFLRGMNPVSEKPSGIYFHRPSAALVEDLDRLVDGS